jgi:hypothetical protein
VYLQILSCNKPSWTEGGLIEDDEGDWTKASLSFMYTNILNQEELLYKTMEVIHGRDRTDGTQIYEVFV